jgi:hypothetical protein
VVVEEEELLLPRENNSLEAPMFVVAVAGEAGEATGNVRQETPNAEAVVAVVEEEEDVQTNKDKFRFNICTEQAAFQLTNHAEVGTVGYLPPYFSPLSLFAVQGLSWNQESGRLGGSSRPHIIIVTPHTVYVPWRRPRHLRDWKLSGKITNVAHAV